MNARSSADSWLARVDEDPAEVERAPAHATGATEIAAFEPTSAAVSRALEKDPAARPTTATMYAHLLGPASPG